ncbi:hypothetical protein BGZ58_000867 [Dissophora ornata]|nr:hypothetical protein BGZ58_000867 [Dissophora ornata]
MAYLLSSSFTYTPDVVDLEAMNITEIFPEASSFDFDVTGSYNHSYSDSISGIPLSQQALWDDGQWSVPQTANASRIYPGPSAFSSLNNSANNSVNHGHLSSRHLHVPPPLQHGRLPHHPQRSLSHLHGPPHRGDYEYSENEHNGNNSGHHSFDEYEESSIQQGWADETRDHNGLMLLNDKEHQDEQHRLFLQDIGELSNVSHGDSISLFAKLADESDLSCDLFKEELGADDTADQSRIQIEQFPGSNPSDNPPLRFNNPNGMDNQGNAIGNEIFSQEFMASLKAPLVVQPPPQLESATNPNFLEGLHTIAALPVVADEDIRGMIRNAHEGSERNEGREAYERARRSFLDSLKIADPITTPHKFAPQPLPILWNEPKIRSKALPSFELKDYKEVAKATLPMLPARTLAKTLTSGPMAPFNNIKRDSLSFSPTNTHSIPNSALSSPLSSIGTSPPTDMKSEAMSTIKTPTAATYSANAEYQQKQDMNERSRRQSTIHNPHLAFDPTITPAERAARAKTQVDELEDEDMQAGSIRRGSLRGSAARKRPSLHQDIFLQEQSQNSEGQEGAEQKQQRQEAYISDEEPKLQSHQALIDEAINTRRGSRPLSVNILPESLTSVNNHAIHQEALNNERARRLSEEEVGGAVVSGGPNNNNDNNNSRVVPGSLSLGHAAGTRYVRSGSNVSNGSSAATISPTTPTGMNPYGTLPGRTPRQASQRPSVTGLSNVYTKPQQPDMTDEDDRLMFVASSGLAQALATLVPAQPPALSKLQTATSTLSRNGSRSSPPGSGLRRPGFTSQEIDFQKMGNSATPSPTDYNDELYRSERDDQQTPRNSYGRQQGSADRNVPEWHDDEEDQQQQQSRRFQSHQPQQQKTAGDVPTRRPSSEQLKEQHNIQRLRVQQQAREEVYGRGNGRGYEDEEELADEFQNRYTSGNTNNRQSVIQQRNSTLSPTRDYFSPATRSGAGHLRSSPPMPMPSSSTAVSMGAQSRYSEHYRRPSKDIHSLMPAPRISPPLGAMLTNPNNRMTMSSASSSNLTAGIGSGIAPRRSISNLTGSIVPSAGLMSSRRSSNNSTGSNSSMYGSAAGMSLHGRSASSGSAGNSSIGTSSRTSMYSTTGLGPQAPTAVGAGGGRGFSVSDGNLAGAAARRPLSTIVSPPKRVSGSFGPSAPGMGPGPGPVPAFSGPGLRTSASSSSLTSNSEYARVFAPPRSNVASNGNPYGGSGPGGYGGNAYGANNSRGQYINNDTDMYGLRPEVPTRQSSLQGVGALAGGPMGQRNSIAALRSGNGGMMSSPSMASMSSPLQLRRATSVNVGGGLSGSGGAGMAGAGYNPNGGSVSLGRNSGPMAQRQQYQYQQQQPQQQQYQYQPSQPQQPHQYQRTSMYTHH